MQTQNEETHPLVVLVHGIWMVGWELQWLAHQLRRAGYRTNTYHYQSVRTGLTENAARLAAFLARCPPDARVIGHSLGGLVAARALCDHPAETRSVDRVVALGTPFLGSATARATVRRLPFGQRLAGRSFPFDPGEGSHEFLRAWTAPQPLGIIAGDRSVGFGHFFLRALPLPNDGMVAVAETRLPGATAHLTLPVNHVRLAFDRRAVAQTLCFLRHGRFAPSR